MPFSYVKDNQYVGLSIELVEQFCRRYGYTPVIEDVDFAARIPALVSGKYDMCASSMAITEERKESINFSEPFYHGGIVLAVRVSDLDGTAQAQEEGDGSSSGAASDVQPEFTDFSELSGKTVSMLTGAPFEELVKSKAPDVGEFTFFNSTPDMIEALKTHKTDVFLTNNAVGQLAINRNNDITLFPQSLQDGEFGIAFAKGDTRRDEWNGPGRGL